MLAELLADVRANATAVEALAALFGVLGIAFSLYCLVDDVFDLRVVAREAEVGGPRWIIALGHFLFSLSMLAAWGGYLHVAMIAAYLPQRPDMPPDGIVGQVAAMRVVYAVCSMLAQMSLRVVRWKLRSLPRERWAALFGDIDRWRLAYLNEHAELAKIKRENYELHAERHGYKEDAARAQMREQIIRRLAQRAGVALPEIVEQDA